MYIAHSFCFKNTEFPMKFSWYIFDFLNLFFFSEVVLKINISVVYMGVNLKHI